MNLFATDDAFVPFNETCSIKEGLGYYNKSNGQCVCKQGYKRHEGVCIEITDENKDIEATLYDVAGERTLNGHSCRVRGGPKHDIEISHGELWWSAQILWFMFKDAPKRSVLDNYAKSLNIHDKLNKSPKSCIAVHIRQGDSCGDVILGFKRRCFSFEQYIDEILKMQILYNRKDKEYKTVYIATDSNKIEKRMKEWNKSSNKTKYFEIISQTEMDRDKYNTGLNFEDLSDSIAIGLAGGGVVQELMQDMWAMSFCDIFIGDFTSSIARISYEIMTIRKQYYPPFVVLSAPWCDNTQWFHFEGKSYVC